MNKSYITKVILAIILIIIVLGYTYRVGLSVIETPIYASQDVLYPYEYVISEYEELESMNVKPTTLEDKIKALEVPTSQVNNVKRYLSSINAPLASKARFFVQAAKYYHIDYRLVAAISVIESTGGKFTYRPYNAWGWGGSGNAKTFDNWEEGIITVSQSMARYYKNGVKTPKVISQTYNPATPNEWARKVTNVMNLMK